LVPYSLSPPSSVEEEEELIDAFTEFFAIQNNEPINEWHGIGNSVEIPFNIDNFLSNYFNVEPSTVEQGNVPSSEGDLALLSPNTLQILDDFVNELTENNLPSEYMNIVHIQTNEMTLINSHSPIIEQGGSGGGIYTRGGG
jgi:hypothetical protein